MEESSSTPKSEGLGKQWSKLEELHYNFFLLLNLSVFKNSSKKGKKIFRDMGTFISSRSYEQCKSHHQKMKINSKNIEQKLHRFIVDKYRIRQISPHHSIEELEFHLNEKGKQYCNQQRSIAKLVNQFSQNLQIINAVQSTQLSGQQQSERDTKTPEKEKDNKQSQSEEFYSQSEEKTDKIEQNEAKK